MGPTPSQVQVEVMTVIGWPLRGQGCHPKALAQLLQPQGGPGREAPHFGVADVQLAVMQGPERLQALHQPPQSR